jgi:hypothetical protein
VPKVQGTYATHDACAHALRERYGPELDQLDKLSMGGKNIAVGPVQRTPSKFRWEVGMPGNRLVHEAWCAENDTP